MPTGYRVNNYSLAILLTSLVSLGLLLPLLIAHCLAWGDLPSWLINLIFGPIFVSQLVSGNGYFAKFIDFLTNGKSALHFISPDDVAPQKTSKRWNFNGEAIGLGLGLAAGIGIAIAKCVLHTVFPYVSVLGEVGAGILFFITNASAYGGLGNRLGRVVDYFKRGSGKSWSALFQAQDVNYTLAIITGAVIGVVLATVVLAASAASFGVLPAVLFAVTTIGVCASGSGYIGRVADFILGKQTALHALKKTPQVETHVSQPSLRQRCTKENIGTVVGVVAGMATAVILISVGIFTLPFFGIGIPKIAAGFLLMAFCVSAYGGLGNRLGYMIDRIKNKNLVTKNISKELTNEKAAPCKKPKPDPDSDKQQVISLQFKLKPKPVIDKIIPSYLNHGLFKKRATMQKPPAPVCEPKIWASPAA